MVRGERGLALATGQLAGVIGQIPGGAITDAISWKRGFAAVGILMSMGAALILALAPLFTLVFVAQALDGLTSGARASHSWVFCLLGIVFRELASQPLSICVMGALGFDKQFQQ